MSDVKPGDEGMLMLFPAAISSRATPEIALEAIAFLRFSQAYRHRTVPSSWFSQQVERF